MSIQHSKSIQEKANKLSKELQQAQSSFGKGDRKFAIKGVDPNEIKKIYAFFCHKQDMKELQELINKLPNSSMCRTNKTKGYYLNILNVFNKEKIFNLPLEDAKAVIGWAIRLI